VPRSKSTCRPPARELPDADAVWETDADNVLGALNGLKSALDVGDAVDSVRSAKKAYVLGERADAFEDADDLKAEIEALESLVADIEAGRRGGRLAHRHRARDPRRAGRGGGAGDDESEDDEDGEDEE